MTFLYKLIYNPWINRFLRNLVKPIAKLFNSRLPFSVSGTVGLQYEFVRFCLKTNPTCAVTQSLFMYGAGSYEFTPLFAHLVKDSNVFFDIGANIGYFTVLGEKINPRLDTFSFEPSKGALHYLKLNVAANNLKNVTVINKAISDQDKTLTFYEVKNPKYPWISHQLSGSHSLQNQFGIQKNDSYPVQATTLSMVVNKYNINQIDLIKLDTECTEHLILASAKNVIERSRPVIITEIYPVIQDKIEEFFSNLEDYNIFQYRK
jgi:FkbM family methyltransferase